VLLDAVTGAIRLRIRSSGNTGSSNMSEIHAAVQPGCRFAAFEAADPGACQLEQAFGQLDDHSPRLTTCGRKGADLGTADLGVAPPSIRRRRCGVGQESGDDESK
jgi:hypothetical protein